MESPSLRLRRPADMIQVFSLENRIAYLNLCLTKVCDDLALLSPPEILRLSRPQYKRELLPIRTASRCILPPGSPARFCEGNMHLRGSRAGAAGHDSRRS